MKFWILCDSTIHYCLDFFCYRWAKCTVNKAETKTKGFGRTEANKSKTVKLAQLGNYRNKGYHLFLDNFFTRSSLEKHFFTNGTFFTGTIRRNKKDISQGVKQRNIGILKFFRNKESFVRFSDWEIKELPLLISTKSNYRNRNEKRKHGTYKNRKIKWDVRMNRTNWSIFTKLNEDF